jgi:hypothetical protein
MTDMVIFDQHTERFTKAWEAFNQLYVLERPAPQPPKWYVGLPWLMIPFSIIAICGIALSALRTAPVFQQIAVPLIGEALAAVEAILAVVVIEVAIVIMRYVIVLQKSEDGKLNADDLRNWMTGGFWLAFGVAILANLYASLKHVEVLATLTPVMDVVIALAVGISAPMLAFIAGDILASLYLRSERRRAELRSRFETALTEWQELRERSWNARKGDYGLRLKVESLSAPSSNSIPSLPMEFPLEAQTEIIPAASTVGHKKQPMARQIVETYFDEHPEALQQSPLEVAAALGIGKSTVYTVRNERLAAQNQLGE